MSATATSPLPASHHGARQGAFWLVIIVVAALVLVVGTGLLRPALVPSAFGLALLMVAGALFQRALREQAPRRLVPIGLAGSLAVKLTGESMLVGRLPCCRVEVPLPTVSSHHCRLARIGTRWYVEDLHSRNGTFVNGRRVRRKRLHVGDKISIGEFAFRVE